MQQQSTRYRLYRLVQDERYSGSDHLQREKMGKLASMLCRIKMLKFCSKRHLLNNLLANSLSGYMVLPK
jgi:hypothetical protein